MPNIQQPKRNPEYVSGKQNVVTGIAEARILAVSWVNGEGRKSISLVLQFGTDTEDGAPGVFVLADENEMERQLQVANNTIKKGVRAYLARESAPRADDIPEETGLTNVSVGKIDGPPMAGDVDISKLDIG